MPFYFYNFRRRQLETQITELVQRDETQAQRQQMGAWRVIES
jgi:hypothetical protein